jgi:hypothetical protein
MLTPCDSPRFRETFRDLVSICADLQSTIFFEDTCVIHLERLVP